MLFFSNNILYPTSVSRQVHNDRCGRDKTEPFCQVLYSPKTFLIKMFLVFLMFTIPTSSMLRGSGGRLARLERVSLVVKIFWPAMWARHCAGALHLEVGFALFTYAKPACMKKTRMAPNMSHWVVGERGGKDGELEGGRGGIDGVLAAYQVSIGVSILSGELGDLGRQSGEITGGVKVPFGEEAFDVFDSEGHCEVLVFANFGKKISCCRRCDLVGNPGMGTGRGGA